MDASQALSKPPATTQYVQSNTNLKDVSHLYAMTLIGVCVCVAFTDRKTALLS